VIALLKQSYIAPTLARRDLPYTLHHGDCLTLLRTLPENSVDAIVTDPPAGIAFMGKNWDDPNYFPMRDRGKLNGTPEHAAHAHDRGFANGMHIDNSQKARQAFITFMQEVFTEALRVIKPGGHAFVWALPRTSHWTATALEDAGWVIRDVVTHINGQGFPKSLDISCAIDKHFGKEREVTGTYDTRSLYDNHDRASQKTQSGGEGYGSMIHRKEALITAPATPESAKWQGYGTALKPCSEHWILCRKPLSEKTIAANVLRWNGCGAINIDASRIGMSEADRDIVDNRSGKGQSTQGWGHIGNRDEGERYTSHTSGRFPSNLLLSHSILCVALGPRKVAANGDGAFRGSTSGQNVYGKYKQDGTPCISYRDPDGLETIEAYECDESCPIRLLGEQSGHLTSRPGKTKPRGKSYVYFQLEQVKDGTKHNDEGTAARYFQNFAPAQDDDLAGLAPFYYCAKSSRAERNRGCEGLPEKRKDTVYGDGLNSDTKVRTDEQAISGVDRGLVQNNHPTVKPVNLLKYLATLITPENGIILDPFMGSGSTGVAAISLGYKFIGIEQDVSYLAICEARLAHAVWEARHE
jgi:DNA modification methylase